jgi:flagellar motor switch protein FliG
MDGSLVLKKDLTPDEKVAVLLASMDQKLAASIIQQLDARLMVRVTNTLRQLGVVPGPMRDKTIAECLRGIQEFDVAVQGDENMANALLVQAVGEKKATSLMNENKSSGRGAFADLVDLTAEQLAGALGREQPAIIAIVFRNLPPKLIADTMDLLPSEVRRRVMVCMCTAGIPSEDVVARIESLVNAKLASGPKQRKNNAETSETLSHVATMLQHAKKSVEEDLLSAVQDKSETIASQLRDMLFTFEDVVRLSDAAIRRLMQEVDSATLAVSLRTANVELKQKFFRNMSKRAAASLKEEMELSQKVRRSEVEAKQKEIVNAIRTLEADGQLSTGASDEYV